MGLFRDLIIDSPVSKISHTKVWSNIGMLAMTAAFLWMAYHGSLGWELFLIYAIAVTQPVLLSKFIDLRFGMSGGQQPTPQIPGDR